jgi:hypothetical protein
LFFVIHFFNEKGKALASVLRGPIFPKIDFLVVEGLQRKQIGVTDRGHHR